LFSPAVQVDENTVGIVPSTRYAAFQALATFWLREIALHALALFKCLQIILHRDMNIPLSSSYGK
jgi:hypothetical protein